MPYAITIDQSTSATKVLICRIDDRAVGSGINGFEIIDQESIGHVQHYPQAGWVEHDADEIWLNLVSATRALLLRNRQITIFSHVSITNQRETIVVFDRKSSRPLRNAIVWQCVRAAEICSELKSLGHGEQVQRKTGLRLDTYFSAPKLKWLVCHEPAIAQQLKSGAAVIGTIDTYLIHRLTRRNTFATDQTNASRTLLFNINSMQWDQSLCDLFDVPMSALPDIRNSSARFGDTTIDGLLANAIPIVGVMGDSQAALFAQGCHQPGDVKVTIGTGSSILLNIGNRPLPAQDGAVTTVAWCNANANTNTNNNFDSMPTYCYEGNITCSAATITWLRDRLALINSPSETGDIAESISDNGGVYLVPAFAGLGAPYWQPAARAAIVGMNSSSGREQIVRAGLESIAYQIRDVLDMLKGQAGIELHNIRADGGATINSFLMQFIADISGLKVDVAANPACSAIGAMLMGCIGMSLRKQSDISGLSTGATYQPKMSADQVSANYAGWKQAVNSVIHSTNQSISQSPR